MAPHPYHGRADQLAVSGTLRSSSSSLVEAGPALLPVLLMGLQLSRLTRTSTAHFSHSRPVAAAPLELPLLLLRLLRLLLPEQPPRMLLLLQMVALQRTWMMTLSLLSLP